MHKDRNANSEDGVLVVQRLKNRLNGGAISKPYREMIIIQDYTALSRR